MFGLWPFTMLGCFLPLLLIVIALGCVRVLRHTLAVPSKPASPSCGKCGYSVEGLPTTSCPECGSQLGRVGVETRFLILRHRGNLPAALIAWTVLIVGAAALVTMVWGVRSTRAGARAAGGFGTAAAPQVWTTPLGPKSKSYPTVDVVSTASAKSGTYRLDSLDLKLTLNDQTTWTMKYDGAAGNYLVEDSSGTPVAPPAPLSGGAPAAALYKSAGLDAGTPTGAAEVAELDRVMSLLIMSPFTQPSQMTLSQFVPGTMRFAAPTGPATTPAEWMPGALTAATTLIVWLLGIWWIVVRRRKVLARCAQ